MNNNSFSVNNVLNFFQEALINKSKVNEVVDEEILIKSCKG